MSSPDTVAVSPDGTRLYVTENVKVLELASGSYPSGEFYYDDQGRLWVVVDNYSAVSVIDTATDTESAMVPVSGASNVTVSPDGSRAYVTGSDGKTVTVIDTRTNTLIGTFTTDQNSTSDTRDIAAAGTGYGAVYVTDSSDNALYITSFDTQTAV